eukprot:ANDGO_06411.mRNA.1 hypothetical protein
MKTADTTSSYFRRTPQYVQQAPLSGRDVVLHGAFGLALKSPDHPTILHIHAVSVWINPRQRFVQGVQSCTIATPVEEPGMRMIMLDDTSDALDETRYLCPGAQMVSEVGEKILLLIAAAVFQTAKRSGLDKKSEETWKNVIAEEHDGSDGHIRRIARIRDCQDIGSLLMHLVHNAFAPPEMEESEWMNRSEVCRFLLNIAAHVGWRCFL